MEVVVSLLSVTVVIVVVVGFGTRMELASHAERCHVVFVQRVNSAVFRGCFPEMKQLSVKASAAAVMGIVAGYPHALAVVPSGCGV